MAGKKTVSLRDLRAHITELDRMVTDAWLRGKDAELSFGDVRKHCAAISAMVAEDMPSATHSPHAATATKSPAAADNEKAGAKERAAYQRAAADKAPRFDPASLYKPAAASKATEFDPTMLGLSHIRKS